jgi:hypothetical protein
MAAEANVKMVVLNHQLAGPGTGNLAEVIVGQDLMVL